MNCYVWMESSNLLTASSRSIKKSSSFNLINSYSTNTVPEVITNSASISDEEDWCQVKPTVSDNKTLYLSDHGFDAENILLYLIDMTILSGEQKRWNKFIEGVDFSNDPGPVRDHPTNDQPSTSLSSQPTSSNELNIQQEKTKEEIDQDSSEAIVKALVDYFKNKQGGNNGELMQIPFIDIPENLLNIYNQLPDPPSEFYVIDGQRIRLRNTLAWRPPIKEFIYELPEFQYDFTTLLGLQGYSCAGCGISLHKRRPNLCFYFNKLFCKLCFQGQEARIPARILHKWDFKEYPVSDIAFKFLQESENQPVFDIHIVDKALFRQVKNLRRIRSIRLKIAHLWEYIKRCPYSAEVLTKYGILRTVFEAVPSRFLSIEFSYMYSILDFVCIDNGNLIEMLKPLESTGILHVLKCSICEQRGFICQICVKPDQIIFPFQTETVHKCEACGSLCHIACYKMKMKTNNMYSCTKCERIRKKRLHQQIPFESSQSD